MSAFDAYDDAYLRAYHACLSRFSPPPRAAGCAIRHYCHVTVTYTSHARHTCRYYYFAYAIAAIAIAKMLPPAMFFI